MLPPGVVYRDSMCQKKTLDRFFFYFSSGVSQCQLTGFDNTNDWEIDIEVEFQFRVSAGPQNPLGQAAARLRVYEVNLHSVSNSAVVSL
jgi:hypothetical protein